MLALALLPLAPHQPTYLLLLFNRGPMVLSFSALSPGPHTSHLDAQSSTPPMGTAQCLSPESLLSLLSHLILKHNFPPLSMPNIPYLVFFFAMCHLLTLFKALLMCSVLLPPLKIRNFVLWCQCKPSACDL